MSSHPIPSAELPPMDRLRAIMHILRAPGGCPWDGEQTHESLLPHLIEEAWEVADAIRSGDRDDIVDELGDLLLQPVFHAEIAAEAGEFDLDDVATAISEKLIRRHPHVFGDSDVETSEGVLSQWEQIKQAEKGQLSEEKKPFLTNKWTHLPALMSAAKLQKKAAKVGFDWPSLEPVIAKVREEVEECAEAIGAGNDDEISEEIGDLLFAVVNLARKTGNDPEQLLARANQKFVGRFQKVEKALDQRGINLEEATLDEMDLAWDRIKNEGQ